MAQMKLSKRQFAQIARAAKIAVFLASDESGWVSGEPIEGAGGHP
jgi:hypothetical protein